MKVVGKFGIFARYSVTWNVFSFVATSCTWSQQMWQTSCLLHVQRVYVAH